MNVNKIGSMVFSRMKAIAKENPLENNLTGWTVRTAPGDGHSFITRHGKRTRILEYDADGNLISNTHLFPKGSVKSNNDLFCFCRHSNENGRELPQLTKTYNTFWDLLHDIRNYIKHKL